MKPQSSRFYLSLAIAVIICDAFLIYRVTKQAPASTTTQAQITEKNQATKATTAKKTTDSERPPLRQISDFPQSGV